MKKSLLLYLMLLTLGLSACLPQATASPTPTVTATAVSRACANGWIDCAQRQCPPARFGLHGRHQEAHPRSHPETVYPPITDADHVKGPADAKVTIIEYSDFQ